MQKKYIKISLWLLFYLIIALVLLVNSYNYMDADLGWHLMVGNEIIQDGNVPHVNCYNYTIKSENWVDHEWLMNLIMALIFNSLGYLSLTLFFVLIIIATLILQNIFIKKFFSNKALIYVALIQLFGIYAMRPHLGIRVQEISLLMITLLFFIIFTYEKNNKIKYLPWLVPLFYLWSNMHGSFLIGFFIIGLWIGLDIVLAIYKWFKYKKLSHPRKLLVLLFFTFLSFVSTLLTPYKTELYSFLLGYRDSFYLTHIEEWLPIFYIPINYWKISYLAVFTGLLILIFIDKKKIVDLSIKESRKNNIKKIPLWFWFLNAFFFVMSIKSKRHFPLFFVSSIPLMFSMAIYLFGIPKIFNKNKFLIPKYIIIFLLFLALIVFQANKLKVTNNPFDSYCKENPCGAVKFLKENDQYKNLRLFNLYGWGGYLIWAWPGKELFIDGRLPQFSYNGHTMLAEYYEFMDKEKIEQKLDEHEIEMLLIKSKYLPIKLNWFEKHILLLNQEKLNDNKYHLREYLDANEAWESVFDDGISVVYVKNNL